MTVQQLNEIEFLEWIKKSHKYISSFSHYLDSDIASLHMSASAPSVNGKITLSKKLGAIPGGKLYMGKGRFLNKVVPLLIGVDSNDIISVIVELVKYGSSYKVNLTIAKDNSPLPAHRVYASFIKMGNVLVSGAQQSMGGQMIWRRLAKEPGIQLHGWDTVAKKPINLGDDVEDDSYTHASREEILDRAASLQLKIKDKSLLAAEKAKIRKQYEDEIADLKYIKTRVVLVASAKTKK